jgi:methyl-accepting chemotaxis protein
VVDKTTKKSNPFKVTLDSWKSLGKKDFSGGMKKGVEDLSKGFGKLGQAAHGVLTKFGSFIGTIGIAAAVVALCTVSIHELNKSYNKNEHEAKKAEQAAQNLTQAYTESKAKYNELVSTISNYEGAKNGLNELTHGTLEFKEAISKANDEALKLLDNYGDLIGERYSIDGDGLI